MKILTILCVCLFLVGCSTRPVIVKQPFPSVPAKLMEHCEPLSTIDSPTVELSDFLKTVSNNYTKYYTCAELVTAWQIWYTEQKKIRNSINK